MEKVKLFISHSSKDKELAKHLISLLENSLEIPENVIRCTSVPGYELKLGSLTSEKVREELEQAEIILAIISPISQMSDWVRFEIGAAWGLVQETIPLLSGGLEYKDLPGPLQMANSVILTNSNDILHLIDQISNTLNWPKKGLNKIQDAQKVFLDYTQSISKFSFPSERIIKRAELIKPEQKLKWDDIEQYCKKELYIWGWSCRNVIGPKSRNIFKNMINNNIKINFLIQKPESVSKSTELDFGPVCYWTHDKIATDIEKGIDTIHEFLDQIPSDKKSNIELRATRWIMTWSGVAIDPETERGILQVEFYHYNNPEGLNNHLDSRPELILKSNSIFYKGFYFSLKSMWENSLKV